MGLQAYGILLNFAKNKTTIMYEYLGLQDVFFIMLYGMAGFFALLACLYLLFRRGNAFAGEEVRSSRVLRRWTAALMAAIAASHVWWYVIGVYWLADDWLVRTITVIMLDHATLVPLVMAVLLALLQDCRRPLWPWLLAQVPVVVDAGLGAPSHAAEAMEMGADAVLVNTALAVAQSPVNMAIAFKKGVEAGREAFVAGLGKQRVRAEASSPLTGFLGGIKK